MSVLPPPNGHLRDSAKPNIPSQRQPRPKKKRASYAEMHAQPLPLQTHPLPAFHPSNPLSLLRLAYTYLSHLLSPPSSHQSHLYIGYFSPETCSVHVTDPSHIRALWESGFFGKGTLSRSEPSWAERERARFRQERGGAEDATRARREERRLFKLERARLEAERIERQRRTEEGLEMADEHIVVHDADESWKQSDENIAVLSASITTNDEEIAPTDNKPSGSSPRDGGRIPDAELIRHTEHLAAMSSSLGSKASLLQPKPGAAEANLELDEAEPDIVEQEHLQLTREEAFFLAFGLGVLEIRSFDPSGANSRSSTLTVPETLSLFANPSTSPNVSTAGKLAPDDQFLLSYVTYHHFRSLGWVVRPGIKFAVDYLLYNRGPVFSHAEFAILIMPAYSHSYWKSPEGKTQRRVREQKDWWWLHCVNRVQSQVLKTLVLCYVEVPPPMRDGDEEGALDVRRLLRRYKVREFIVRRWLANRSRD